MVFDHLPTASSDNTLLDLGVYKTRTTFLDPVHGPLMDYPGGPPLIFEDEFLPEKQLFEGRLALNPGFFFLCSKEFSQIIFDDNFVQPTISKTDTFGTGTKCPS